MRQHCVGLTAVGLMLLALLWSTPFWALHSASGYAAPGARPPLPQPTGIQPAAPVFTPGARPTRNVSGTPQRPAATPVLPAVTRSAPTALPQLPGITPPAQLPAAYTPVAAYQAAEMIRSFARQYLGVELTVGRAVGVGGDLNLPASVEAEVGAAVAVAGQAAAGAVTSGSSRGLAEVAVGSGTISGDLQADISGASVGSVSLLAAATPPRDEAAALTLVRSTYPALANVDLQAESTGSQGSYLFVGSTVHEGIDPKSRQVTAVVEEVLAGTMSQGRSTIVWAVAGNGVFAASLQ